MFPRLSFRATFVADTNFVCRATQGAFPAKSDEYLHVTGWRFISPPNTPENGGKPNKDWNILTMTRKNRSDDIDEGIWTKKKTLRQTFEVNSRIQTKEFAVGYRC